MSVTRDELWMYNVIPGTTTKKKTAMQRDTVKNSIDKSKWNSKNDSSNSQKGRKGKTEKNVNKKIQWQT